ncbi:hypothetical protein [Microbacterium sp. NPDC057650]|uniref:hypothetical protein n=1 Tax=unclassified Microbacterium TaxID=2609290 RepID=UPI00367099BE
MLTTFGGGDLPGTLSVVLLVLAVIGAIVLIVTVWGRRRGDTMVAVKATLILARLWLIMWSLGAILTVVRAFSADFIELQDPVLMSIDQLPTGGAACEAPSAPPSGPVYLCDNTVYGASLGVHMALMAGTLFVAAAALAIGWAIAVAATQAIGGEPFHPTVARTFGVSGLIVLGAGLIGSILQQLAMNLAVQQLPGGSDEGVPFYLSLEYWPLLVSLGCFAMAAIFRHGARLQRETEGLV